MHSAPDREGTRRLAQGLDRAAAPRRSESHPAQLGSTRRSQQADAADFPRDRTAPCRSRRMGSIPDPALAVALPLPLEARVVGIVKKLGGVLLRGARGERIEPRLAPANV